MHKNCPGSVVSCDSAHTQTNQGFDFFVYMLLRMLSDLRLRGVRLGFMNVKCPGHEHGGEIGTKLWVCYFFVPPVAMAMAQWETS